MVVVEHEDLHEDEQRVVVEVVDEGMELEMG